MAYETITHTVIDYANGLTEQHHQTLEFLYERGYISAGEFEELTSSTMVVPVKNTKQLGQRILEKFFLKESSPDIYTFVISELHEKDWSKYRQPTTATITKLTKVIDNED